MTSEKNVLNTVCLLFLCYVISTIFRPDNLQVTSRSTGNVSRP